MRANIHQTTKQKLILHLGLYQSELDKYLLQTGKQPQTIFTIIIYKRRKRK